jgi:hypothetical protein
VRVTVYAPTAVEDPEITPALDIVTPDGRPTALIEVGLLAAVTTPNVPVKAELAVVYMIPGLVIVGTARPLFRTVRSKFDVAVPDVPDDPETTTFNPME